MSRMLRGECYDYKGWIVAKTEKAFGVAADQHLKPEFWIPHRYCFNINYVEGGDSEDIRVGSEIRNLELDPWMAKQKGLCE